MRWLAEQMVWCHSLWANEEPGEPQPCQQQHDDTDGQAQQQPVPKVNRAAVRINPELKEVCEVNLITFFLSAHRSFESVVFNLDWIKQTVFTGECYITVLYLANTLRQTESCSLFTQYVAINVFAWLSVVSFSCFVSAAPLTGWGTRRRWGWATSRAACSCLRCWTSRQCWGRWLYRSSGPVYSCWELQSERQQPAPKEMFPIYCSISCSRYHGSHLLFTVLVLRANYIQ